MPHPLEAKMHVRLQTYQEPASDVIKEALHDLKNVSTHIYETFTQAMQEFELNNPQQQQQ